MDTNGKSDRDDCKTTNRKGQGIAEFALLLALIAVAVTLALTSLGKESEDALKRTGNALTKEEEQPEEEEDDPVVAGPGCGF